MTNRRTFLTAAGAAVSCMALPLASMARTAPPAAPAIAGPGTGTGNVEQWLLGKGQPTLTRADLDFIRNSRTQSLASTVDTCDAR